MYELFKAVIEPYFLLLASQGVLLIWTLRRGTSQRRWLWSLLAVWVLLVILSTPMVGRVLSATLTWPYRPSDIPAGEVDAIVVLGGGLSPPNAYRPRAQVTGSSYVRCLHAADLYERYRCPLILCGGATEEEDTATTEAEVMADALAFLGVKSGDLTLETTSLTTRENAVRAIETIRRRGFENVILVTHARHMGRADLTFRKLGFEVIPGPCGYEPLRFWGPLDETWVPGTDGLGSSNWAIREWMALAFYRLRGWI